MSGPHLIYFADPMCSWCWGFSPVIDALRERFGPALPIRLILGGLYPGNTEPMTEASKRETREHWEHVQEASGQPFDYGFFDRQGFVYDTEPASRAVIVARREGMDRALDLLKRIQTAFYAHNRDVTDEEVLADLAAEDGHDRDEFLQALRSDDARRKPWRDFGFAEQAGIRGFPCLLAAAEQGGDPRLVTSGYRPAERILPPLGRWLETVREAEGSPTSADAG